MRLGEIVNLYVWLVGKLILLSPVPPCGVVDLFGRVAGRYLLACLLMRLARVSLRKASPLRRQFRIPHASQPVPVRGGRGRCCRSRRTCRLKRNAVVRRERWQRLHGRIGIGRSELREPVMSSSGGAAAGGAAQGGAHGEVECSTGRGWLCIESSRSLLRFPFAPKRARVTCLAR
jgi:hypothetical protein